MLYFTLDGSKSASDVKFACGAIANLVYVAFHDVIYGNGLK